MKESIKIVSDSEPQTLTIKGSKFHSYLYKAETREEVDEYLQQMKKQHYKASHVCYAFRIGHSEEVVEFSTDAGEPSGTAGKPIIGELQKYSLTDAVLFVVRYFGGTKLGIRGLIDAYGDSAELVLKNSKFDTMVLYKSLKLEVSYSNLATIEYQVRNNNGIWHRVEYGNEGVTAVASFDNDTYKSLQDWLSDMKGTNRIDSVTDLGNEWIVV